MAVASTLINGSRPSFVDIVVSIAGNDQPRGSFLAIDYGVTSQPGEIYSKSRSDLVGTTPGYTKATGQFEMLVSEANDLFGALTDNGQVALTTPTFDMAISYSSNAIDVQTDRLLGCRIIGLNAPNKGTSATNKSVQFIFNQLVTNGVVVGGDTSAVGSTGLEGQAPVTTDFWYGPVYEASSGDWVCPGFVGNTYSKEPWDAVFIAIPYSGTDQPLTPGICEVTCDKGRSFDKKKPKGADGGRLTLHGIELAEGEIEITIWTPQQYRVLMNMWPLLFPGPQKFTTTKTVATNTTSTEFFGSFNTADGITSGQSLTIPQTPQTQRISTTQIKSVVRPFDVSHPKFKLLDVKSVVFVKGSGPDPGPSPFARVFKMHWVEYNPPGKVDTTTTPASSKASTFEPVGYQTPGSNPANSNLVSG